VTGITVSTPLNAEAWALRLAASHYPNPQAAETLVRSLRLGVDLGFRGERNRSQVGPNLSSALEHPDAIRANLLKEISLGRRAGPYPDPPFPNFYSNPLGVVFRRIHSKPRIIHHLSWPRHSSSMSSVNAGTLDFEVSLDALDQAIRSVRILGAGCYLAKLDIEAAYRCIPVRPEDWPLLGMLWEKQYYFDTVVQFGLASATAIFEWFSSAAHHILQHTLAIDHLVHYVDDFMLIMHGQQATHDRVQAMLRLFKELGIPISADKLEGPLCELVFLGILFDTVSMTIRLSDEKLHELQEELTLWANKRTASREELQSLIGKLSFAAKVVPTGRTFLRRMIDHTKSLPHTDAASQPHPLSSEFQKDALWWRTFISEWNGVSLIPDADWSPAHTLHIHTDACCSGYGAVFESHWFAGQWTPEEEQLASRDQRDSMPFKELYALALAASTWGRHWKGRKILFHCDSLTIVQAWRRGDSRKPHISGLIRTLLFIAASHDFNLNVMHIAGVDNVAADLLSRGQVQDFLSCPGLHDPSPTIPSTLPTHTW
jgi:hypothetical protein